MFRSWKDKNRAKKLADTALARPPSTIEELYSALARATQGPLAPASPEASKLDRSGFVEFCQMLAPMLEGIRKIHERDPGAFAEALRHDAATGPISRTGDYGELSRLWEQRRAAYLLRQVHRHCPCCGGAASEPLFTAQDGFPYVRCRDCAMWYVTPYLPDDVWAEYQQRETGVRELHDRQFEQSCADDARAADRMRFNGYFEVLKTLMPGGTLAGCTYLDIGCFTGNSLAVAAEHGLRALGVEKSPRAVEYVRAHRPRLAVYSTFDEARTALAGGQVDFTSLWESLEHATDPLARLQEARALLRPGGLLALTVPNARSALPMILREYCFYCFGGADLQGHINLFAIATLERLLARAGFQRVFVETHYSTDWQQVIHYLSGEWDKIYCPRNLMTGSCLDHDTSAWSAVAASQLGPELSRLEAQLELGPMIFMVASAV